MSFCRDCLEWQSLLGDNGVSPVGTDLGLIVSSSIMYSRRNSIDSP